MDARFTEKESLAIIGEMIDRARNNFSKGSGNSLIINGLAVGIVALLNYFLLHILPDSHRTMSFWVWTLMIPAGIIDYITKRHHVRSTIVKTQIDGIISGLWRGFTISVFILIVLLLTLTFTITAWFSFLFTPVIMLFIAIAEFAMARAMRFKAFYWGAICFWLGAVLCLLSYVLLKSGDLHFLILAVCMAVGFVLPGCRLNHKAKDNV